MSNMFPEIEEKDNAVCSDIASRNESHTVGAWKIRADYENAGNNVASALEKLNQEILSLKEELKRTQTEIHNLRVDVTKINVSLTNMITKHLL